MSQQFQIQIQVLVMLFSLLCSVFGGKILFVMWEIFFRRKYINPFIYEIRVVIVVALLFHPYSQIIATLVSIGSCFYSAFVIFQIKEIFTSSRRIRHVLRRQTTIHPLRRPNSSQHHQTEISSSYFLLSEHIKEGCYKLFGLIFILYATPTFSTQFLLLIELLLEYKVIISFLIFETALHGIKKENTFQA